MKIESSSIVDHADQLQRAMQTLKQVENDIGEHNIEQASEKLLLAKKQLCGVADSLFDVYRDLRLCENYEECPACKSRGE